MVLCLCLSCLCALMCYTYIVESCTVGNESPQWDTLKTGLNGGLFIYVSSSENEQNVVITDSIRNLVTVIRDPSSLGRPQVPLALASLTQAAGRAPRRGRSTATFALRDGTRRLPGSGLLCPSVHHTC